PPATSSGTPTSPSARTPVGAASPATWSQAAATSSTTPAVSTSTSSRSSRAVEQRHGGAIVDRYDRRDGQATLQTKKPPQAARPVPTAPLPADGADLVARRTARRPGYRCARASPAAAEQRRRHRAARAPALTLRRAAGD